MNSTDAQTAYSDPNNARETIIRTTGGFRYQLLNRINKLLTAALVIGKLFATLLVELYKHLRSLLLSPLGLAKKRKLSQTLFSIGLSVTGERLYNRFEFKARHCRQRQLLLLNEILQENKDTEFGKKHNFANIRTVQEFRKSVPVHTYDLLESYVARQTQGEANVLVKGAPISYATTSGTTGRPKFIPITKQAQLKSHQDVSRIFFP